jgi:hypothetical protein
MAMKMENHGQNEKILPRMGSLAKNGIIIEHCHMSKNLKNYDLRYSIK